MVEREVQLRMGTVGAGPGQGLSWDGCSLGGIVCVVVAHVVLVALFVVLVQRRRKEENDKKGWDWDEVEEPAHCREVLRGSSRDSSPYVSVGGILALFYTEPPRGPRDCGGPGACRAR